LVLATPPTPAATIPSPLAQVSSLRLRGAPEGIDQNFGGGLYGACSWPQASFEDLRLGQDLYEEGSAQLDGGLPADDDDQQADGQTAVEFCSRLFKELPAPLLPTPESPPPRATLPHTRKPRKMKTLRATCSSLRLAAKPSAVPVAERVAQADARIRVYQSTTIGARCTTRS
jgi:hypothetical protein